MFSFEEITSEKKRGGGSVVNYRTTVDHRNIAPKTHTAHADAATQQRFPSHNCTFQRFTCLMDMKFLHTSFTNTSTKSSKDGINR